MKRKYVAVILLGRDRPFRAPGKLVHAQEVDEKDGKPLNPDMAICGRMPREDGNGMGLSPKVTITCKRCKERML